MRYTAEVYTGRNIGSSYMEWVGVQIVAIDDEMKRRYVFEQSTEYKTYKTPCFKMGEWASHYRSGMNADDSKSFDETMKEAQDLASKWNEEGTHETK